jgi:hypothetical protein
LSVLGELKTASGSGAAGDSGMKGPAGVDKNLHCRYCMGRLQVV